MNEINSNKKLVLSMLAISVGIMVAVFGIATIFTVEDPDIIFERQWKDITEADADPGAGESGVLNIFIYPHSADPATDYGVNITEGGSYSYGHLNSSGTGNVPYDTTFDIVVKVRFNETVAQASTNNTWQLGWVNSTIRCPVLSINVNTTMSKANITTTPSYMWVNFYMNNGGVGYTIGHGVSVNITHIIPRAYW